MTIPEAQPLEEPCWIDTHCHLDAAEFDPDRDAVIRESRRRGLKHIVIPAVDSHNFGAVAALAGRTPGAAYALGIHPICTPGSHKSDIELLREAVKRSIDDPRFVAIGEIGLDFFLPELTTEAARARQQWFYQEQLKIAAEFRLPVLVHVRRSQDALLKQLRLMHAKGARVAGIAHAFNGSRQQADAFIALGFKLGFGGTVTYERSLRIRRLAAEVPPDAVVLETDAPDIPPAWLHRTRGTNAPNGPNGRNAPSELPRIAESLALLRGWSIGQTAEITTRNAYDALPRLRQLSDDGG